MCTCAFLKLPAIALDLPRGITQNVQLVSNTQLAAIVEPALDRIWIPYSRTVPLLMQAILAHDRVICELFQ